MGPLNFSFSEKTTFFDLAICWHSRIQPCHDEVYKLMSVSVILCQISGVWFHPFQSSSFKIFKQKFKLEGNESAWLISEYLQAWMQEFTIGGRGTHFVDEESTVSWELDSRVCKWLYRKKYSHTISRQSPAIYRGQGVCPHLNLYPIWGINITSLKLYMTATPVNLNIPFISYHSSVRMLNRKLYIWGDMFIIDINSTVFPQTSVACHIYHVFFYRSVITNIYIESSFHFCTKKTKQKRITVELA